jgi:hypothetical protein
MEASPINMVLHYWNYDPDFSERPGKPKVLSVEGEGSFASLVKKYAGDIPPGALKTDFCRAGVARESPEKTLTLLKRYYFPSNFHDDYVRNIAFSLSNLATTLAHNAALVQREGTSEEVHHQYGRFERYAFTERLSDESIREFQFWVRSQGAKFVEEADHWIGNHEIPRNEWGSTESKIAGVGVFFFVGE